MMIGLGGRIPIHIIMALGFSQGINDRAAQLSRDHHVAIFRFSSKIIENEFALTFYEINFPGG